MVSNTLSYNINSCSLGRSQSIQISEHNNVVVGSLCYTIPQQIVFVGIASVAVATVTITSILFLISFQFIAKKPTLCI